MNQHLSHALRPNRAARATGWLVVVVILFVTIISSIGRTSSHGFAAFPAALHVTATSLDTFQEHVHEHVHEHAHEDGGIRGVTQSAGADHPHHPYHHGADHSHDKAHALPVAWSSAAPQLPGWFGHVRLWIEMLRASRLERPPMG